MDEHGPGISEAAPSYIAGKIPSPATAASRTDRLAHLLAGLAAFDPGVTLAAVYLTAPDRSALALAQQSPSTELPAEDSTLTGLAQEAFLARSPRYRLLGRPARAAMPIMAGANCQGVLAASFDGRETAVHHLGLLADLAGLVLNWEGLDELTPILSAIVGHFKGCFFIFASTGQILHRNLAATDWLGPGDLANLGRLAHDCCETAKSGSIALSALGMDNRRRSLSGCFLPLPLHGLCIAVLHGEAQMEESHQRRESFFDLAIHELRNLLSIIKTYFEVFTAELSRHEGERLQRAVTSIRRNVERLLHIVQDLQDHSRLEQNAFHFNFAQISTEAILEAVTPEAQLLCMNNGLELETIVRGHGIGLWDRLRIEQVLLNLITNAVKFSQTHGRLRLTAVANERYWQVSIADQGIGLTEQDLEQVFRPFYRAKSAVDRDVPGSGLGLAICEQLIRGHGGSIWAESLGPGSGSTFHFALPLLPAEPAPGFSQA